MTSPQGPHLPHVQQKWVHLDPQEPPEHSYLEDYWKERKNIEEDTDGYKVPVEMLSLDETAVEEAWLRDAGLSTLVSGAPKNERSAEALLSTLTRSQAAFVKKRMNNYTQTLCMRNKQPVRHVRDIFPTVATQPEHNSKEKEATAVNLQPSLKLPLWLPVQNAHPSESLFRRETLSFEIPYSEGAVAHKQAKHCQDCQTSQNNSAELLTFQLPRPKLGLTGVQDLSAEDMKNVGCIAVIELSTLYDFLGIEFKRSRTLHLRAGRETGLFGVPLTTVLQNDQKHFPETRVPLLFKKLLSKLEQTGLQAEGILRVSGSVSRVKHLRQELESKFYMGRFNWEQVNHNEAADLLKMFIRELPQPLLTEQYLPAFSALLNISSPKHQIQALHLLIMLLPGPHRDTLKDLLEFLSKVVAHEEKNRMNLWNISMILAPNLFTCHGKAAKQMKIQEAAGEAYLVRLLIIHQHLLWTVPCFMIAHLRRINESSLSKRTLGRRKLLRRRHTEHAKEDQSDLTDVREGVIRIRTPLHTKAIQLNSETKAKDIVSLLHSDSRASQSVSKTGRMWLFEVGGNIGERCLDPDTYLLDLYRVNPSCEWVIKSMTF